MLQCSGRACLCCNKAGETSRLSGEVVEFGSVQLTHAVLHHHEAALVALEALALKVSRRVHTRAVTAEIRGDPALIDI